MKYVLYLLISLQTVFILMILFMTKDRLFTYSDMRTSYYYGCVLGKRTNCSFYADFYGDLLKKSLE